ncbi:MAG: hypothetical protein M3Q95_07125 [Bacteroidota bacterium]|nr:hypothetical protein [Bacteroidota bacterium]
MSEFHPEKFHPAASLKYLIKRNLVTKDSLIQWMNFTIENKLKLITPGAVLIVTDSMFYKLLSDSTMVRQMLTTNHIKAVQGKESLEKIAVRLNSGPTFYNGIIFNEGGILAAQELMRTTGADYFLILGKVRGKSKFSIEYELYDRNFVKLAGNKYEKQLNISRTMYWNTFLFYMDKFAEAFCRELNLAHP